MVKDRVSGLRLFLSFLRLGLTAFGGPAMVVQIKQLSVERNKWLDEATFRNGVALSQAIPGATAMQTAAYVGLKVGGVGGAMLSFIGFGLPAFALMLLFAALYEQSRNVSQIVSLFNGLQVIVVALVAHATYTFGKNSLKSYKDALLAALAAILFWAGVSPFIVIAVAGLAGVVVFRDTVTAIPSTAPGTISSRSFMPIALLCALPAVAMALLYIMDTQTFTIAATMLRVDLFAFGGGFASLPLMLHEVVYARGWMDYGTFMDGIALGQVTPGPIVITATFVGFMTAGFAGAVVATLGIFTPSFLMLVGSAPFFDKLKTSRYFSSAIKGILASFVGLLLFVTINFALNVPWDIIRALLAIAALTALFKKVDVLYIVLAGSAVSVLLM
jgi:chromate transporter